MLHKPGEEQLLFPSCHLLPFPTWLIVLLWLPSTSSFPRRRWWCWFRWSTCSRVSAWVRSGSCLPPRFPGRLRHRRLPVGGFPGPGSCCPPARRFPTICLLPPSPPLSWPPSSDVLFQPWFSMMQISIWSAMVIITQVLQWLVSYLPQ